MGRYWKLGHVTQAVIGFGCSDCECGPLGAKLSHPGRGVPFYGFMVTTC